MKKKSIISIVVAVSLAAVALVGATLAYFTDKTQEAVNTFTVGNVDIDLTEPSWDPDNGKNLYPGASVEKDPIVTNIGEGDGYIVMKVEGMRAMKDQGFSAVYDAENWDLVDAAGNKLPVPEGNALADGYYVYNKGPLASGKSAPALFTEVKLSEDAQELATAKYSIVGMFKDNDGRFTYDDEANLGRKPALDAEGNPIVVYIISDGNGGSLDNVEYPSAQEAREAVLGNEEYKNAATFVFDLKVQGFAIQTTGFDNFADYTTWMGELVK